MIHKVNVVKKIAFLLMTMALAGAIVACQGAVTSPATVANEIGDIEFDVGGSAKKVTLTGLFNATNPKYSATSSKESVAAVSVSGAVLTVTPKDAGTATVKVTADGDEGKASQTFTVTVTAPPVIVNKAPTVRTISPVSLQVAGTKMIELSDYFTDPEGDALRYTAASSDDSVATVTDGAASMITITAVADGTAEITVSASDGTNDAVPQTFDVTVSETPPPNERPKSLKPFEDVTLTVVDDPTEQIDLSGYFDDADDEDLTYTPSLSNDMYATATVDGSMLTITAVAAGTATITVTASDGKESVSREIDVTVNAESNKAPALVAGLSRDVFVTVGADAKTVDLSQYFSDPEGAALIYSASSSNNMYATAAVVGSMLTVTPVAAGMPTITATASDGELSASLDLMVTVSATPNVAPEVSGSGIPDQSLEMDFMVTTTLDLSMYFSDIDSGPNALTYGASSSNNDMSATVDGSMLTIEAVAAGSAMITVTATDGAASVPDMFTVTVTDPAVPTTTSELPDQVFDHDDMAARTFPLSGYFSMATNYAAVPDDESVVGATEAAGVLTLTPVSAGRTVVTITPSNSGGAGSRQTITVIVESMPVPTDIKALQSMTFPSDDAPPPITLSEYFSGAAEYKPSSNAVSVVEAAVADGVLTLTPVSHGTALVTVTPSNSGGTGAAQSFNVTVQARPMLTPGKMLDPMRLEVNKGSPPLDLSTYFEDPDGSIAKYRTVTSDAKTVAVYNKPKATVTDLDKAAVGATVILHARNTTGNATITVTVTDNSKLTFTKMFVVTVVSVNNAPTIPETPPELPDYSGATRFKSDDGPKNPIDAKVINLHFLDADLKSIAGDSLMFSVMYVITNKTRKVTTKDGLIKLVVPGAEKVADPVATAVVEPKTWDGDRGGEEKFTVTVTPNKAGAAHDILIVATDLAGEQAFRRIPVQVNHAPESKGAQKTPLTLSSYVKAQNLKSTDGSVKVPIVARGGGYFSDKDMSNDDKSDTLTCSFRPSVTGDTAPAELSWSGKNAAKKISESVTLEVKPKKDYSSGFVPMTVAVWCSDRFEKTVEQTFIVSVTAQASIH